MRCLYCKSEIKKFNLSSIIFETDQLCIDCRSKLKINRKIIDIGSLKVETLYNYDDGIFRDLLIQYKECYDEALANVFLYMIKDYIKIKYHSYHIVYVPSSDRKRELRGFNHLKLIFKDLGLMEVNGLTMKRQLIQEGMNYSQRKLMLDNYIYCGKRLNKVLIVDDVVTTGSSLLGVYKAIEPYCADIKALSLARKETAFINRNMCARIKKRRII